MANRVAKQCSGSKSSAYRHLGECEGQWPEDRGRKSKRMKSKASMKTEKVRMKEAKPRRHSSNRR